MLFQPIDDKTQCVGVYVDGRLIFEEKDFPENLTRTWKYSAASCGNSTEYAWLYAAGATLGDVCPDNLKEEWEKIYRKMTAYKKSFDIAKINLRDHCFFDLVPHDALLELCELKNKITQHVFDTYERPPNYEYLDAVSKLLHKLKYRDLNIDASDCRNLFASGMLRTGCQKILAGPRHIEYNLFGTKTGRLTTMPDSFPILTMKKELRRVMKPQNDWFLSLDYNGAEVRTFLALCEQEQPEYDIHQWNIENVFENPEMFREDAKTLFFAWLYNPDAEPLSGNYYDREKVLDKYYDGEYINTVFGRQIEVGAWKALNYIIQSTTSDLVLDRAIAIDEMLDGCKSCISHIVHDEIVIDFSDEERHLVADIKDTFAKNKLGNFKVNLHAGKNYFDLGTLSL